jgi:hypothetical protein
MNKVNGYGGVGTPGSKDCRCGNAGASYNVTRLSMRLAAMRSDGGVFHLEIDRLMKRSL